MLAMQAPVARFDPVSLGNMRRPDRASVPVAYVAPHAPVTDDALLAASVRLRVEDPQGHSCGSGTIIDANAAGEALVLTCGHLFRDSQGTGKIEVDVFGSSPAVHLPGRLVGYDLQRDVGLVAFRPQGRVTVARVAPPGYGVRAGDAVTSVGCNHGDEPSVQHSQVISVGGPRPARRRAVALVLNLLEVAAQPVEGRSGGGLFSSEGMVIGVCNAAEPTGHEGLYATLESIRAALDQKQLASLYKQPIAPPSLGCGPMGESAIAAADPFSAAPRVRLASQKTRLPPRAMRQLASDRRCRDGWRRAGRDGRNPSPRGRGLGGSLHHPRPRPSTGQERNHHLGRGLARLCPPTRTGRPAARHAAGDLHGSLPAAADDPRVGRRDRLAAPGAVALAARNLSADYPSSVQPCGNAAATVRWPRGQSVTRPSAPS